MMQKFIITKIKKFPCSANITGQDAKHIFKVLRKKKSDKIAITDGRGKDYNSIVINAAPDIIQIKLLEQFDSITESPIDITLCSGMLKNRKMDFIIKHVTQLGIQKWVPFFCERSIPSPNKKKDGKTKQKMGKQKMGKQNKRWESIAKESLKQCNRSYIPQISEPSNFQTIMKQFQNHDLKIAFWEQSQHKIKLLQKNIYPKKIVILIGPEGGFSENEILLAKEKGFLSYSLGPRILRAETASISACTLIQHLFGDI